MREASGENRDMHIDYPSILEGSAKLPQGSAKLGEFVPVVVYLFCACNFIVTCLVMLSRATVNCKLMAARSGG